MHKRIQLYDAASVDELQWPDSEEAVAAKGLPLTLLKEGVHTFIPNIQTRFYLLKVDDYILPITVNEREYNNSYLTSNYYAVKQMRKKLPKHLHLFVAGVAFLFKSVKINQAVIVNNWLLSSSLYPALSGEQVELVTRFLEERFPDHLLMFRGLNEKDCDQLLEQLQRLKYHSFYSRKVFLYDPEEKRGKKAAYHRRRDRRLMEKEGYTVEEEGDFATLIALYNSVYRDKHTYYCPHYTTEYLEHAVKSGFLQLKVLKQGEAVRGVFGFSVRNGIMIVPFFGYDSQSEERTDVYRILTMLILEEAEKRNVRLNDGSGGDNAKTFRGMQEANEFVAIYTRHLPLPRKLFWALAEKGSKIF